MRWPFGPKRHEDEPDARPDELVVLVDASLDPKLVVYHDPQCFQSEQYRSFRTNLRALNPGDSPRALLFTSGAPDEGKTTSLANIALSLAEFDQLRVCAIDLDLRAPRLHELFDLPLGPGVSDVLIERIDPRRALQPGGVPNLRIMSAGTHVDRPTEVISSDYVTDLLGYLKREYQYILVDAPPTSLFADASHLSKVMDGVILVVSLRDTQRAEAEEAIASVEAAGGRVIGSFVVGAQTEDPSLTGTGDEV